MVCGINQLVGVYFVLSAIKSIFSARKGKIKEKKFNAMVVVNGLLQCEFTNELRAYREDIQIICNHIAVKNQTYFLCNCICL